MIKINKMKNWYGISELKKTELISKNTIIYSPNGVMKTSFADGIKDLISNNNPKDIFNDINSEYEIDNNGTIINEFTNSKNIDAIVFSGLDINNDIYSDHRIAKLLVSQALKKEYQEELKKTEAIMRRIKEIISKDIAKDLKYNENTVRLFINYSSTINELDSIIDFIDNIGNDTISHDITKIKFSDLFGEKTQPIIDDPDFVMKCEIYNRVVLNSFDEVVFKADFSFDNLKTIRDHLMKLHFFEAGHSVNLIDEMYDEKKLNDYIDKITSEVYGSEDVKKAFDDAKAILDKKANQKLKSTIDENPWILSMLSNTTSLKKKLINTNAAPFIEELKEIKISLLSAKKRIKEIIDKSSSHTTEWDRVLAVYNQRFINKNFEIVIGNSYEAILDIKVPIFEKKLRNNGRNITSEIQQRFSSGEKRAIYILSLLYEIELAKIEGKEFTLVLDDIVDSFDYKNKYSMIEYLKDLANEPKIQLIILTHNFDFYRSCRITIGSDLQSKLLAYEVSGGVELIDAKNKEFENFSFISNWKSQAKTKSMIALLPFIRNIYEIKDGSSNTNYKEICHFLHYDNDTVSIKLNALDSIFDSFSVMKSPDYSNNLYFETLIYEVNRILSEVLREDKLLEKILLGIFIRLSTDKILLDRYINQNGSNPIITGNNWTLELYRMTKPYLSPEEFELYNKAITIAPSFLHVNGFMYEPLVDVGLQRIIEVVNELKTFLTI